jgi:ATP-dependent Clp protease ATP-binding subunit ClpB
VRQEQVMAVVRQHFRPEFLNRLDAMVMFNPLDKKELERIALLQVDQLQRRLTDRRITLDISDEALQWLVNKGYEPAYGARPLRRLIQTAIGDPLAKEILSGQVHDGDTVAIGTMPDGERLTVTPQR